MPFQAGKNTLVKFTVAGGSQVTVDIQSHSWKEAIDKLDITSASHAGTQALLAGIFRGDGKVKGVVNTDNGKRPWVAAYGIQAGNNGVMLFYFSATHFFTVPCMVIDVEYTSEQAGKVEFAGSVSLNAEAGVYSYPG